MRVIRAINPERALRLPADEWQAPALNDPLGTSGRPKTAIYLHRHTYLRVMETVAGRALLPPDLSEMAAHRVTQAEVIAFCRNIIAHFNAPKTWALRTLPKTAPGKIQKFILRAKAHEMGLRP
jgi:acyl-CoA synthetase (AMP-forming)/AMP-acid ligase II